MNEHLASVDLLPGHKWSAKGAAGDALQRVPHDAPFIAIWLDGDKWRWSNTNTDFASLSQMAAILAEFSQACVREALK